MQKRKSKIHRINPAPDAPLFMKPSNPKDDAAVLRIPLSMIPATATAEEALAFYEGHRKYGSYNWRIAGVSVSVYMDAMLRHAEKYLNGQDRDPKTLVHELASVRACCAIIIDAERLGMLNDDRPPRFQLQVHHQELEAVVEHLNKLYPNGPGRYTEKQHGAKEVKRRNK